DLPSQEFWAIPVEEVGAAVILDRQRSATGDPIETEEVEHLDPGTYRSMSGTTRRNREWIAHLSSEGKRGAWFNGVPHVLTRGPVALASAAVIDWSEACVSNTRTPSASAPPRRATRTAARGCTTPPGSRRTPVCSRPRTGRRTPSRGASSAGGDPSPAVPT